MKIDIQITNTNKCIKNEYFVSLFKPKDNIPFIINRITFIIAIKKTDNKSKFGVQGPDLYSEDELKIAIAIAEIA